MLGLKLTHIREGGPRCIEHTFKSAGLHISCMLYETNKQYLCRFLMQGRLKSGVDY